MKLSRELTFSELAPDHPPRTVWRVQPLLAISGIGLFLATLSVFTIDQPITRLFQNTRLSGDVRRELEALQQFGAASFVTLAIALIASLDPKRLRRFFDYALAIAAVTLIANAFKWTIGRGRPSLNDHLLFIGPFQTHTVREGAEPIHAWDLSASGVSALQAMPSTHTTSAVVLAIFLACLYPRLKWFALAMALLVPTARVVLTAHWTSDVIAGAALAIPIATIIIQRCWGVRLLDFLWLRVIDRNAKPALPNTL